MRLTCDDPLQLVTYLDTVCAVQTGTSVNDHLRAAVVFNGSYVFAGSTQGDWGGASAGGFDWAAFKVDTQGDILWRWQVRLRKMDMRVPGKGKLCAG